MNYDNWKTTPYYMENKDMTRVDELETAKERLQKAAKELSGAIKGAVLSRSRRARIESVEQEVYDIVGDIEEELSYR